MTMALLITLLVSRVTWHALDDYRYAADSSVAGRISMHLVRASDIKALERGFTSGFLASKTLPEAQQVEIIQQLRQSGDKHQKNALTLAKKFIEKRPKDFALKVGLEHEVNAANSLREARNLVDRQFKGEQQLITPQEWFKQATYVIGHNKHFRDALSSSVLEAPFVSRPYWTVRHWAWRISENAGRERGILAIQVAGNTPISSETLEQLNGFRDIVKHELEMLSSTKIQPGVDRRLVRAIEEMEAIFFNEYERTRQSIYTAANDGNYPLSHDQWLEVATNAINSILNVSEVSSKIIHEVVTSTRENKLLITKLYLLLLGFTIVLVVLAIRKVKQSAKALVQSKEFAEKTAEVLETEVNERRYLEQSLRSSQKGFRSLVMQNPTGIVVVNSVGGGLFSNLAAQKMLNRTEEQFETEGIQIPLLIGCQREVDIICADGSQGKAEARISETVWNDSPSTLILLNDISEREAMENELEHISYHDTLTGLPNRLLFSDRVRHAVIRAKRDETMLALLIVYAQHGHELMR
ncbi:MAG: GGDEF domain-containing protein [Candidatus Sedimenticola sp. (ex Thyasira tokunagai)]